MTKEYDLLRTKQPLKALSIGLRHPSNNHLEDCKHKTETKISFNLLRKHLVALNIKWEE